MSAKNIKQKQASTVESIIIYILILSLIIISAVFIKKEYFTKTTSTGQPIEGPVAN